MNKPTALSSVAAFIAERAPGCMVPIFTSEEANMTEHGNDTEFLAKEAVALLHALEELAKWPDLPGIPYWVNTPVESGSKVPHGQRHAIPGYEVGGIMQAIKRHAKALMPFAEATIIKSRQAEHLATQLLETKQVLEERCSELESQAERCDELGTVADMMEAESRGLLDRIMTLERELTANKDKIARFIDAEERGPDA